MPTILGANSVRDTGYNVDNSLRLNDGDSPVLSKTASGAGNRRTWTISWWFKRSTLGGMTFFWQDGASTDHETKIAFDSSNRLFVYDFDGSSFNMLLKTNRIFRDDTGWYHAVIAVDTTDSTSSNRIKMYINGVQETSFETASYPSQNHETEWNSANELRIGKDSTGDHFDGYITEIVNIDGSQLAQTSFGEFDEDSPTHWKPIDVSGLTFGTNGFHLDFEDSSALGNDVSGNNNDFSPTNLAALDQTTDTCTNNFCTFTTTNPSASNFTLSEGNCKVNKSGAGAFGLYGTNIMLSKGKWYFEVKFTADAGSDRTRAGVAAFESVTGTSTIQGDFSGVEFTCTTSGRFNIVTSGSNNEIDGFNSYSTGDIIQFALDMDNQRLYVGINGNFFNYSSSNTGGNPASGSGFVTNSTTVLAAPVTPYAGHSVGVSGTSTLEFNFGNPTFSISSGNSDSEGFGNFEFSVPSGYFAICTKNLAEYGG